MEVEYYPTGEDVILQNEAAMHAYILVFGVAIIGKANSPGEMFGEIGILYRKPQLFGVRTIEVSQVLQLNKTKFLNLLRANPTQECTVMNNLYRKLSVWKSLDVEGQPGPSFLPTNWLLWSRTQITKQRVVNLQNKAREVMVPCGESAFSWETCTD